MAMRISLLNGTALVGLVIAIVFAGCASAVQEPVRTTACKTPDGDAGQTTDNRTISISSLSGCTITPSSGQTSTTISCLPSVMSEYRGYRRAPRKQMQVNRPA